MKTIADIDIDFADRNKALEELFHIPASRIENGELKKHNSGVYFQDIPIDPLTGLASIEYEEAEQRGYFKLDFLNVRVYPEIKDEEHLITLMNQEPIWEMLEEEEIVTQLFQIHDHFEIVSAMKPKSIEQLAMVLALIRPAKYHLIGKTWQEMEKDIWTRPENEKDRYAFRKGHAFAYSLLIVVQMNLMLEQV
jgi:DNA polymerase III alpha subunit